MLSIVGPRQNGAFSNHYTGQTKLQNGGDEIMDVDEGFKGYS